MEEKFKKLNLQLFADGGEGEKDNADGAEANKDKEQETKTFTQADFDRETSKMYAKLEEKFNKRAEQTRAEAEKLGAMNAEEKAKYQMEQREKEIAEKERNWAIKENKYECSKILAEKNLPIAFADFVVAEDADTMKKNIDLFDREFKKCLAVELDKRTKGKSPAIGALQQEGMTKEKLATLSRDAQIAFLTENPKFLD